MPLPDVALLVASTDLLRALTQIGRPATVSELASRLNVPSFGVRRRLISLAADRWVRAVGDHYELDEVRVASATARLLAVMAGSLNSVSA